MARNWKPVERRLAEILGGDRVPVSGRTRGWAPDIEHPWLALEIKSRLRMPIFLANAMDQAVKSAQWAKKRTGKDKMPMVVIHEDGTNYDNCLVVVRLKDAREWWGIGDGKQAAV